MTAAQSQPSDRPLIGVAVVVIRQDRVLLGRRKNAHGHGCWQFPGGHLEYGESIEACARRELMEETGMVLLRSHNGPFTNDRFEDENKHYVTLYVVADETAGEAAVKEPHKCERWDWFRWSQLPEPRFLPIVNLINDRVNLTDLRSPAAFIKEEMAAMGSREHAKRQQGFFKTDPGAYGYGDRFIGIRVPELRRLAQRCRKVGMPVIEDLLHSPIHEHRHLALFLLIHRFNQSAGEERAAIVDFYLAHTSCVNNWDLVDCSAHAILGAFLLHQDRSVLYRLARSQDLWERRIAMVATWHFIRAGQVEDTLELARMMLNDTRDLIHKAAGWMLREAGKRDESALIAFLDTHKETMPRTMLRYAIERFDQPRRQAYLRRIR
jgi:ADP-ribose pyrophosphatase YjhB (NUDIX family)/3-methyladenine DNA glycosylase AlkD